MINRKLILLLNLALALIWLYWAVREFLISGLPELGDGGSFLGLLLVSLTPFLTLLYLITSGQNKDETIFSLWIELKKKKLKEQIEDKKE